MCVTLSFCARVCVIALNPGEDARSPGSGIKMVEGCQINQKLNTAPLKEPYELLTINLSARLLPTAVSFITTLHLLKI